MEGIPQPVLTRVLDLATRAPSVHNTQPWRWRSGDNGLTLHTDPSRQLELTDPTGRDLVISCGAALRTLAVAAAAEGWHAVIERFPDPDDPGEVARVHFVPSPVAAEQLALAEAARQRRTDRRRTASWPVPEEVVHALVAAATRSGTLLLDLTAAGHEDTVLDALAEARRSRPEPAEYADEQRGWGEGLGVPATSRLAASGGRQGVPSRFPTGVLEDTSAEAPTEDRWLLLSTSSDDALSWLRAGEALQAVWLAATVRGLGLVPSSEPIEVDATRDRLRRICLDDSSCPQLLLRVGWAPDAEDVPPTPRLPLQRVMDDDRAPRS
jgi:hypothetical protein